MENIQKVHSLLSKNLCFISKLEKVHVHAVGILSEKAPHRLQLGVDGPGAQRVVAAEGEQLHGALVHRLRVRCGHRRRHVRTAPLAQVVDEVRVAAQRVHAHAFAAAHAPQRHALLRAAHLGERRGEDGVAEQL